MSRSGDLWVHTSASRFRWGFGLMVIAGFVALIVPVAALVAGTAAGEGAVSAIGWGQIGLVLAGVLALVGVVLVMQGVVELAANLDLMTLAVVTEMSAAVSARDESRRRQDPNPHP